MDTYEEVRAWLFEQLPNYQKQGATAYKPGLEKMESFMAYLGDPHKAFKSIHVAGTNGKGSTSHMICSVLMEAGYKTGLYTSPHLKDFPERIRINGSEIETSFVVAFVQKHQVYFIEAELSFFELTVGMCFEYFKEQQIEIAVVEVGLGGRLDATNVIHPIVSVITNIGIDHTQFLGDTLALIAEEKAGIIKKEIPVVIGETQIETFDVFTQKAKLLEAPIQWADTLEITPYETDLLGAYQAKNMKTAIAALRSLKLDRLIDKHVRTGLLKVASNTHLKGRWQVIGTQPLTIADVTHNAAGFSYVIDQIKNTLHENLHLVLGFVKDKEIEEIFRMLPKHATYYFCAPKINRAEDISTLVRLAEKNNLRSKTFESVAIACKSAAKNAGKSDLIYIGGSTFVISEIL